MSTFDERRGKGRYRVHTNRGICGKGGKWCGGRGSRGSSRGWIRSKGRKWCGCGSSGSSGSGRLIIYVRHIDVNLSLCPVWVDVVEEGRGRKARDLAKGGAGKHEEHKDRRLHVVAQRHNEQ